MNILKVNRLKGLTDDVADASNSVSGAVEGGQSLHGCCADSFLQGTTKSADTVKDARWTRFTLKTAK